jgi:hypothetical protein
MDSALLSAGQLTVTDPRSLEQLLNATMPVVIEVEFTAVSCCNRADWSNRKDQFVAVLFVIVPALTI